MADLSSDSIPSTPPAPYPQEAILIDALSLVRGERVVCTSPGLAQFAAAVAGASANAAVTCVYLDLYRATLAREQWSDGPGNLQIACGSDLPAGDFDVVALPCSAGGEAELTRELIQQGHQRLRIGGRMLASTDRRADTWLGEQMRKVFVKTERQEFANGALYVATKTQALRKLKNFDCEFAFRDRGRLIRAFSRPGVFSHRHIDSGARQLIEEMEVHPGERVLDVGCGAGVVALAAACRAEGVSVLAIDSHTRAIECTRHGAETNQLSNVTAELNADGRVAGLGTIDVVVANPPYYAGLRIAEHFLHLARSALRPDGRVYVVCKHPDWYTAQMPNWFHGVSAVERKGYHVFRGRRPTE